MNKMKYTLYTNIKNTHIHTPISETQTHRDNYTDIRKQTQHTQTHTHIHTYTHTHKEKG